jgi:hypothetical protein
LERRPIDAEYVRPEKHNGDYGENGLSSVHTTLPSF